MTTRETLETFQEKIQMSNLSQSVQDAIITTRRIGLRYLWVDALCILQQEENLEDFKIESLKMAQCYSNAYVTLAAGSAADSQDGFLNARLPALAGPCRLAYSVPAGLGCEWISHSRSFVYACLPHSTHYKDGPLDRRAWTLQEQVMSPRILKYEQEQMQFRCEQMIGFEDGRCEPYKRLERTHTYNKIPERIDVIARHPNVLAAKAEMFRRWYEILEQYTRRSMTDPEDKLTAIAGIAECIHNTVQCKYLFGLWEDDLIRGLLWSNRTYTSRFNRPLRRPNTKRAPSWSWASVEGPVITKHLGRQEDRYCSMQNHRIKIVAHATTTLSFDPLRMHYPFELQIQGVLKSVRSFRTGIADFRPKDLAFSKFRFVRAHGILLEPVEASSGETDTSADKKVVGAGLFDVPEEEAPASLWCTRLVIQEGLLLARVEKGVYRRVGVFQVADENWFDQGETEEFTIT